MIDGSLRCEWPFERRQDGGRRQRFCLSRCRSALHTAARRWAIAALARGELTVADLRNELRKPYTASLGHSGASAADSTARSEAAPRLPPRHQDAGTLDGLSGVPP
jgi:hypothetical protein